MLISVSSCHLPSPYRTPMSEISTPSVLSNAADQHWWYENLKHSKKPTQ